MQEICGQEVIYSITLWVWTYTSACSEERDAKFKSQSFISQHPINELIKTEGNISAHNGTCSLGLAISTFVCCMQCKTWLNMRELIRV